MGGLTEVAGVIRALGGEAEVYPADRAGEARVQGVEKKLIEPFRKLDIPANNGSVNIRAEEAGFITGGDTLIDRAWMVQ